MSAIAAERRAGWRPKFVYGLVALVIVVTGVFALWYRSYYNIWPGQDAAARTSVRAFGSYSPLGVPRQRLYAALSPGEAPGGCATTVYLRTGRIGTSRTVC